MKSLNWIIAVTLVAAATGCASAPTTAQAPSSQLMRLYDAPVSHKTDVKLTVAGPKAPRAKAPQAELAYPMERASKGDRLSTGIPKSR